MAFWEAEKSKLGNYGATVRRTVMPSGRPVAKPSVSMQDPHAIAAAVPEDVKKPTDIVLPPPTGEKTKAVLITAGQLIQEVKTRVPQVKDTISKVKSVSSSLKGFFGFGAANVSPVQKVQITGQGAAIAKQAVADASDILAKAKQAQAMIAQHRADLLKDKAQIANENAKLKNAIARKVKHKTDLEAKTK